MENIQFYKDLIVAVCFFGTIYFILSCLGVEFGRGGSPYMDETPEYLYDAPIERSTSGGRVFK